MHHKQDILAHKYKNMHLEKRLERCISGQILQGLKIAARAKRAFTRFKAAQQPRPQPNLPSSRRANSRDVGFDIAENERSTLKNVFVALENTY